MLLRIRQIYIYKKKSQHKSPADSGQKAGVGCSTFPWRLWTNLASTSTPADSPLHTVTSSLHESAGELSGKRSKGERTFRKERDLPALRDMPRAEVSSHPSAAKVSGRQPLPDPLGYLKSFLGEFTVEAAHQGRQQD